MELTNPPTSFANCFGMQNRSNISLARIGLKWFNHIVLHDKSLIIIQALHKAEVHWCSHQDELMMVEMLLIPSTFILENNSDGIS